MTGLRVQACGDCHLLNFGAFATPERRLVFDINDLDETLPAPWEWDVKRLAASFVLACRNNGFSQGDARDAVLACVRSYRERMAEYSDMPVLEVWYASIDVEKAIATIKDKEASRRGQKRIAAARARSVLEHDFPKLAAGAGHAPTIKDDAAPDLPPQWRGGERAGRARPRRLCQLPRTRCRTTDGCSSTVMRSRTTRSRWSVSAASVPSARSRS